MKLLYISSFIYFFSFGISQAQTLKKAHKKFKSTAYIEAQQDYLKIDQTERRKPLSLLQRLGDTYYINGAYEDALEWYAELTIKYNEYDPEYLFKYSQCLRALGLYKKANTVITQYYERKGIDFQKTLQTDNESYSEGLKKQSGTYELTEFKGNTSFADKAPQFYGKSLVFSSSRDTIFKRRLQWNNQPLSDLYIANKYDIYNFDRNLNSKFHEESCTFSKSLDTIYFSRSDRFGFLKRKYKGGEDVKYDIYRAVRKKGKWSSLRKVRLGKSKYTYTSPFLSPDGKRLYFSSNMPGSIGKKDLFYVNLLPKGKYGKPVNLGSKINSFGDEDYPFITENNLLYFSSNGHLGLGGLDVFVISNENKMKHQVPINLGEPINSTSDDFGFIIDLKENKGYMSSNRDSGVGSTDIYELNQLVPSLLNCSQSFKGHIVNAKTGESTEGILIDVYTSSQKLLSSVISNSKGLFEFDVTCGQEYILKIIKNGVELNQEIIKADITEGKVTELEIPIGDISELDKIKNLKIKQGDKLNDILKLSKIYYNTGDFSVKEKSKKELDKIVQVLTVHKNISIIIKSYTDYIGTRAHNYTLSQKRAEAARDYIIKKGKIQKDRVEAKGMGELQPDEDCKDCKDPKVLEKYRKSEFIVKY